MPDELGEQDWGLLIKRIKSGRCTPFIGAGACDGIIPLGSEIARTWAKKHKYPLQDNYDLARVAQYVAVTTDPMEPKYEMCNLLATVGTPNSSLTEPHRVLANLPLPVFITTNYDDFMVQALTEAKKNPRQELCRWNKFLKDNITPNVNEGYEASPSNPAVFHLHGHRSTPQSLVLSEDDYLGFLVKLAEDETLIPPRIRQALTGTSLLFLGYRIADWDFRVLFHSLASYLDKSIGHSHISVQIAPTGKKVNQGQLEKTQSYLNKYYGKLNIRVYWGTCQQFVTELARRWKKANAAK